jgi:hypothetical protein
MNINNLGNNTDISDNIKDTSSEENTDISDNIDQAPPEKMYDISNYIKRAVSESQILVSYISRYSPVKVDREATKILIESNFLIKENIWGPEQELKFWDAYDNVASTIEPVTIESLKATMPNPFDEETGEKKKRNIKNTDAARSVTKYRLITTFTLIFLLLAQVYWINGSDLTSKLGVMFKQIDAIGFDIEKKKLDKNYEEPEKAIEINQLIQKQKQLIQEFGATYRLLQQWNRLWQILTFKEQFRAEVTHYVQEKYEEDIENIRDEMNELQNFIKANKVQNATSEAKQKAFDELRLKERQRRFEYEFDKERNKFFLTRISAEFIIRSLQVYLLPLLYGLLGAIIYTLRKLAGEIKNLTYTQHSETKYSLRITMGLLGGLAIGWFLKPDELGLTESLSPMAISFLVGYNVEILFSIMDKFIDLISKFTPAKKEGSTT